MPLNPLFWISCALLIAAAVFTWRRVYGRDGEPRTQDGPVPGYTVTAGTEMDLDPSAFELPPESWRPISLETFHSSDRSRIIVTVRVETADADRVETFLRSLAQNVQARSHAQVVLVECDAASACGTKLLYTPDRRGWSGSGVSGEELVHRPSRLAPGDVERPPPE